MKKEIDNGWISLHRKIQENKFYPKGRPFTQFEAWIDLLLNANHKDTEVLLGNEIMICERGQSLRTQLTLSKHWSWSRHKVRCYLALLEKLSMVSLKTSNKTTIITICNYNTYQNERPTEGQRKDIKRTTEGQRKDINNNVLNNDDNDNNENNINIPFDDFWNLYDKKVDRVKCEAKWLRLTDNERIECIKKIPEYKRAKPDKQFRRDPATFLNNRTWESEIISQVSRPLAFDPSKNPRKY